MSVPLQKIREIVLQLLYSSDLGSSDESEMIALIMGELAVTKKTVREAWQRMLLIRSRLPEIDPLIARTTRSYSFERIQTVERSILRLGVFELLMDDTIPPKVAITEAMRLARKFSSAEAALFVNAILDHIHKESIGKATDESAIIEAEEKLHQAEENAAKSKK